MPARQPDLHSKVKTNDTQTINCTLRVPPKEVTVYKWLMNSIDYRIYMPEDGKVHLSLTLALTLRLRQKRNGTSDTDQPPHDYSKQPLH